MAIGAIGTSMFKKAAPIAQELAKKAAPIAKKTAPIAQELAKKAAPIAQELATVFISDGVNAVKDKINREINYAANNVTGQVEHNRAPAAATSVVSAPAVSSKSNNDGNFFTNLIKGVTTAYRENTVIGWLGGKLGLW